jgi:hypothetical protein
MEPLKNLPVEIFVVTLACAGGIARYLNGYANGQPFKLSVFIASTFVAGFSGLMFWYLGVSMNLPNPFLAMMAGVGGFMGEQSLKYMMEIIKEKTKI